MVGQLLNRSAQEKSSREFTAGSFIDIKLFLLPKSLNNFEFYFLIDIAPEVGGPRIIMIKKIGYKTIVIYKVNCTLRVITEQLLLPGVGTEVSSLRNQI